jgi:pyruvate dehydrogenase E2 component (dihydrolipoamide acetyltransferase)
MAEFRMPSLGADMDRGTLLEWKIAPGDTVTKGDIVAVIDTEKSDIEVESFHSGVVEELLVPEGEEVEVGTALAIIREDGAAAPVEPEPRRPVVEAAEEPRPTVEEPRPAAEEPPPTAEPPVEPARAEAHVYSPIIRHLAEERGIDLATVRGTGPGGAVTRADLAALGAPAPVPEAPAAAAVPSAPVDTVGPTRPGGLRSSPLARKRADELGVDLVSVTGTGPDGAITVTDVEAAAGEVPRPVPAPSEGAPTAPASAQSAGPGRESRSDTVRAATGRLMARSKREIPHYYLSTTIDLSDALGWLEAVNRDRPITERILPAALLLRASVLALADQPRLNGWWVDDELRLADTVDLGVGVALRGGGLIAPVIPGADRLDLDGTMDALRGIVGRSRSGRLKGTDLGEASVTVTNLGDQGVDSVYGVIAPPQVAVVGFGAVRERPWAVEGMLTVRPILVATLSADHRATDGHEGARFLSTLDHLLHEPEAL